MNLAIARLGLNGEENGIIFQIFRFDLNPKCSPARLSADLRRAMQEQQDPPTMQATKHTTKPMASMPPKPSTQTDKF